MLQNQDLIATTALSGRVENRQKKKDHIWHSKETEIKVR